jgi:hypothetical protein
VSEAAWFVAAERLGKPGKLEEEVRNERTANVQRLVVGILRDRGPDRRYGHTPLSVVEDIPWRCRRLVIGTGADGALPMMQEVEEEARRRKVDLLIAPTAEAIKVLSKSTKGANAVLHVTC